VLVSVRNWSRIGATTVVGGLLVLGVATPAWAAPGDASGTAFTLGLNADAAAVGVLNATTTLATATAPPDETATPVSLTAGLGVANGVTATSGALTAEATSSAVTSTGNSAVDGLDLSILDQDITAGTLSGSVTCPAAGGASADTVVTNLVVFGTPVTAAGNATVTVPVTVTGLGNATLTATIRSQVETTTAASATATALAIDFTLTGDVGAARPTFSVGSLTAGNATCEAAVVPTATGLTPGSGPDDGGTTVTVTGSGFIADATTVTIGGTVVPAGAVDVLSPTSLTFVTPAHAAGPVQVVVGTIGGSSAPLAFAYLGDPTATGITPPTGSTDGGTSVTVTGTNFVPGATSVTIGGNVVPATAVTVVSPTTLTFATPAHAAGPVQVAVTTPSGTSGPLGFTYLAAAPVTTGLAPGAGPVSGGTTVTVTGSGFVPGATTVAIDGVAVPASAVAVTSPTTLTFRTPAHTAGAVAVTVTSASGTSAALPFTYLAVPSATGLTPSSGPTAGGRTVTVTGSGFVQGATTVTIGGVVLPAADVEVVDSTTLRFLAPARGAGLVTVVISTEGGSSTTLTYRYTDGAVTTAGDLAYTGFDISVPLLAGFLALIGGAGLLVLSRRRRGRAAGPGEPGPARLSPGRPGAPAPPAAGRAGWSGRR
jgi:LPXTG-motif cell wall-anchored protein